MTTGLLKYFRPVKPKEDLPNPKGKISEKIPSSSIVQAKSVMRKRLEQQRGKRGPYVALTPAQRFSIGKRVAENGVTATLSYYAKAVPDLSLKETTVRRTKDRYLSHLKTQCDSYSGSSNPTDLQVLPYKKEVDLC